MTALYTPEIADIICARIACGQTVQKAISGIGYPTLAEFYAWLRESEEFRRQYEIARECKGDTLVEEALSLADECAADRDEIAKVTLQVNTRKWIASKFYPKRYGERIEHSGTVDHNYSRVPIPAEERDIDALDIPGRTPTRRHSLKPN